MAHHRKRAVKYSDLFWLGDAQLARLAPAIANIGQKTRRNASRKRLYFICLRYVSWLRGIARSTELRRRKYVPRPESHLEARQCLAATRTLDGRPDSRAQAAQNLPGQVRAGHEGATAGSLSRCRSASKAYHLFSLPAAHDWWKMREGKKTQRLAREQF